MSISRLTFSTIQILILSHIIAVAPTKAEPVKYVTEDHLVPRKPEIDGDLRPVLENKLFLTPADCALLLIRPPEKGESAVSVYSQGHTDFEETFYVTLTEAEGNLDMALAVAGGEIEEVSKIAVKRCDARIPKSTALALRGAWRAMLDRTKESNVFARPSLHRRELEFALVVPNAKRLYATLPNKGGRDVDALVRLGLRLAAYCKAPAATHSSLAKQIERDAKRLRVSLSSPGGKKPLHRDK